MYSTLCVARHSSRRRRSSPIVCRLIVVSLAWAAAAGSLAAQEAAVAVGISEREDFRAALAAVLVSRYEHLPVFEQAFDLFWQDPRLLQRALASFAPAGEVAGERDPEQEIAARIAVTSKSSCKCQARFKWNGERVARLRI